MLYPTSLKRTCWICGNDVPTTGSRDEFGNPVHNACLAARAALASAAILGKKPPARTVANRTRKRVLPFD
jgi:hypothetical protein